MYDLQFKLICEKVEFLAKKAGLKKQPKVKRHKESMPLAYYNGLYNRLGISERLLALWQKGEYSEDIIDMILAHEFGHAIGHQKKSHHNRKLNIHILLLVAIIAGFSLGMSSGILVIRALFLLAAPISFVLWVLRLPKVIRLTLVLSELEADRNAVDFGLVEAKTYAKLIVKRSTIPRSTLTLSTFETISCLWNMWTHPSLAEQLNNLNCKLEEPIEVNERA